MADFDFDELDRAVNTALGSDEPDKPQEGDTLETITPEPVAAASTPAQDLPDEASASPVVAAAPAARRSSGRFMDVVHPSSDMRPGSSTNSSPAVATTTIPRVAAPSTPSWAPASGTPAEPSASMNDVEDWQKPLESPFLTNTKVEKRPLGGEAPTTAEFDALELLEAPDDPRLEAGTLPDPIDFAEQSNPTVEAVAEVEEVEAVIAQEPEQAPVADVVPEAIYEEAAGYGEGSFQPEIPADVPAGPASISQQYKEQPSTTPEPGAIYDTEAYHKPVGAVVKKKSGVWVVLWILLIVLLGGGAGAAIYFYVLPML